MVGEPVTFTTTVTPASPRSRHPTGTGTGTGTVIFNFGDGSSLSVPLAGGSASVSRPYTGRSSGPYTVTATYIGGTSFAGSAAPTRKPSTGH